MSGIRTMRWLPALLGCALLFAPACYAQGHGGPPAGGGQGGPGSPGRMGAGGNPGSEGGGAMRGGMGVPPSAGRAAGSDRTRGSMLAGPVGRWWDDRSYANVLSLRPEQKKRMDAIFNESRGELTQRYDALRQEESRLEAETRDGHLSRESIFGQIDRVAQARDALGKANTRLMMNLRKELDPEQAARIQAMH